jgi:hypothetical protein
MIIRENDQIVDNLEAIMMQFPEELIDGPLVHKFTDGMYIREIFMPAGSLWTSKIHKTEHPYVVSYGKAAVSIDAQEWYEITAPYTGITKPGTRRVLYILEDCIWTTFHRIDGMKSEYNDLSSEEIDKIVEEIEDKILEPHINQITGSDVGKEYKEILKNKNQELWLSQSQDQQL